MPLQLSRFEAESILQALTGGAQPSHRETIVFDREAGWRFEAFSSEESELPDVDAPNPSVPATPPPSGGGGGGGVTLPAPVSGGVLYSLGGPWQASPFSMGPSYATGDIVHAPSPNVLMGLPIGAADRVLASDGLLPQWVQTIAYGALPTGGGTWANGGDLSLTGGAFTINRVGAGTAANFNFNRDTGSLASFNFQIAGVSHWNFRASTDDNQFSIVARDDAGGLLTTVFTLNRGLTGSEHALVNRPMMWHTNNTATTVQRTDYPGNVPGTVLTPYLQLAGTTAAGSAFSLIRGSTTASVGPQINFVKLNNGSAAVAAVTAVVTDHLMGRIVASAADGVDLASQATRIDFVVTGGVSANRVPGSIRFFTAPAVADDDIVERMRLGPNGNLGITSGQSIYLDGIALTGDTRILESSANVLDIIAGARVFRYTTTSLGLDTNDSASLGTAALSWSDLFLATGGVVNWNNGNATITHTAGRLALNVPLVMASYTVATLPAGVQGMRAFVTDAAAPAFLAAVAGGGAVVTPVFYNGAAWVAA